MHIPQFWIKAEAEEIDPNGKLVKGEGWGWSERDENEARARAQDRARRVAQRLARGEVLPDSYSYGDRPICEVRLREEPFGIITRSNYGSLILNTPNLMFIDVDAPKGLGQLFRALKKLFGVHRSYPEVRRLKQFQRANQEWSFRVYKTYAGFRYLVISAPQDPQDQSVTAVMDAVGADPLYLRLCKAQKCFRARVSPKPWRCGLSSPPVRFPFSGKNKEDQLKKWEREYQELERGYCSARFLETVGQHADSSLEPAITLHDSLCRSITNLPLA